MCYLHYIFADTLWLGKIVPPDTSREWVMLLNALAGSCIKRWTYRNQSVEKTSQSTVLADSFSAPSAFINTLCKLSSPNPWLCANKMLYLYSSALAVTVPIYSPTSLKTLRWYAHPSSASISLQLAIQNVGRVFLVVRWAVCDRFSRKRRVVYQLSQVIGYFILGIS